MNEPRLNLVQMAGMLARDPLFRVWIAGLFPPACAVSEDGAARFIRIMCGIESRRELAENDAAEERFHRLIRKPFVAWKEANYLETTRG